MAWWVDEAVSLEGLLDSTSSSEADGHEVRPDDVTMGCATTTFGCTIVAWRGWGMIESARKGVIMMNDWGT